MVAFFVGLLALTNRDYLSPFGSAAGQLVLLGVCGLVAGALWGMVVLSRPARAPRLLRVGPLGRRTVIWAALLGGALAAGCWLIARALVPPVRPLRVLADELAAPRAETGERGVAASTVGRRWRDLAVRLSGGTSARLAADLAVLERTPTRHTLDKLGYGVLFLGLALVPTMLFPFIDVDVPLVPSILGAVLFGAVGWWYPDLEVRSRALRARRAWSQALTVYVDLVGISLAGGAGVEDALMVAARAGKGPQFAQLDATLRAAQTRRRKLWVALDELGHRGAITPLQELASAVDLAAESGSRIRETLLAKANALRVRQLAEAEAEAQKASETMGVAPALMAIAAVVLIGYPALARFLSG